jgi:hypothetical protein
MSNEPRVFIVTPAWKRYDVSKIVFSNFFNIKKILKNKMDLQVVVIANDLNLKIAKSFGFSAVRSNNDFLGKKFNDGYEFAFKNGAEIAIPVGSDSLITSDIIGSSVNMSREDNIVFSSMHSVIREDGKSIGAIKTASSSGNMNKGALWLYRRGMMKKRGFRPCADNIGSGCDRSTIAGLLKKSKISFVLNDINFYQHVGIKSKNLQICKYSDYKSQFVTQKSNLYDILEKSFSKEIVAEVRAYYAKQRSL